MLRLEEALLGLLLSGDGNNNDAVTCTSFASCQIALVELGRITVSVAC